MDRERELATLERSWRARGPQLLTVWGRRRVGKSTLLSRFARGKRAVYIYGTRMPEQNILGDLAAQLRGFVQQPRLMPDTFTNWFHALDALSEIAAGERLLIIFDEFQFLCESTPGLDTLVQRWWDLDRHKANFMVVVASSGFSFMRDLTGAVGALHGRRTGQIDLTPFDYLDAARFFPDLTPEDRVRAYACLGGMPAYLAAATAGPSLHAIIAGSFFDPGAFLFREGEELLRTEFHQEALYAAILRAVAAGERRPSDIARAVGRGSADEIFDHLRRLLELHILQREVPITETHRARSTRVLYRLADPYLRFWFQYIVPSRPMILVGRAENFWERDLAPGFDEFVARTTWEEVCVQHLWRRVAAGTLEPTFQQLGRWWDNEDEIDLVGTRDEQVTLVGECKWTGAPVRAEILLALRRKAAKLQLTLRPLWVLASRSGFEPELRRLAEQEHILLIAPDDLYAPELAQP
jgi:AAA+ ATPase superfamily predicted ATPase